jgi:hypothetical protein
LDDNIIAFNGINFVTVGIITVSWVLILVLISRLAGKVTGKAANA